jgi:DNA modification methylase
MILTDPPYNVLQIDRDSISHNEMEDICKMGMEYLKPNGVIFIFCSDKQIPIYFELLSKHGYHQPMIFMMTYKPCKIKLIIINK